MYILGVQKSMDFEFDPAKNAANLSNRGISFSRAAEFDFQSALIKVDDRQDYGEVRYQAVGFIGRRLHVLVFTETAAGIRVISLRKANLREQNRYDRETQS